MPALLERPKLSNAMARALHRHIMMERERKRQEEEEVDKMMEQKMKEEQERRKKKEMEERMSLEETKEQVCSPLISPSSFFLCLSCLYLLSPPFSDPEVAREAFGPTGREAPAFPAAQESFT